MKKTLLILSLFLISLNSFTQTNVFEAKYTIKVIENATLKDMPKHLKDIYYSENSIAENLEPSLYFNDSISEYVLKENIIAGKIAISIFCGCSKPIFTNLKEKIIFKNNTPFNKINIKENDYVLVDTLKTNWIMTSESKYIQNYLVYKASQTISYNIGAKQKSKTVIAWYCPELPFGFGPKGYGGLPGLIIELQDDNTILGLKNMKQTEHNFEYEKTFDTGKKITEIDLNKIIKEKHSGAVNDKINIEKQN